MALPENRRALWRTEGAQTDVGLRLAHSRTLTKESETRVKCLCPSSNVPESSVITCVSNVHAEETKPLHLPTFSGINSYAGDL